MFDTNDEGRRSIIQCLVAAFMDDPMFKYLVPADVKRANMIHALARINLALAKPENIHVLWEEGNQGESIVAGAGVSLPANPGFLWKQAPTLFFWACRFVSLLHWSRLRFALVLGLNVLRNHIRFGDQCGYIAIIGVSPKYQGSGYGALLLKMAEQDLGPSIYLETTNPINLPFYFKKGYRQLHKWQRIAKSGEPAPTIWYLRKPS